MTYKMSVADKLYAKRDAVLIYCGYVGNAGNEEHIWFRGFLIATGGVCPLETLGVGVWAVLKMAVRHQMLLLPA